MKLQRALVLAAALVLIAASAALAVPASDLNGAWHFVLDTPGGDRTFDATFTVDGEQVTGKLADSDVKGTFKDGVMDLSFPFNSAEAGSGTLNMKGTLKEGSLTGNWDFAGYSGTFKAAHPAAQ